MRKETFTHKNTIHTEVPLNSSGVAGKARDAGETREMEKTERKTGGIMKRQKMNTNKIPMN